MEDDPDEATAPILNSEDEEETQRRDVARNEPRDIARNEPTNQTPRQDQPVNLPETISSIVSSRRSTNSSGKKGKEDLIEIFTMKMLQRETDRADDDVRDKREREERAKEMRLMRDCTLYTTEAAEEKRSVEGGGWRRIKNTNKTRKA